MSLWARARACARRHQLVGFAGALGPAAGDPGGASTTIRRVTAPVVVILAAGQGTRMRSRTPKLLHPICGRPMIGWPVAAARAAGAGKIVVVDAPGQPLRPHLDDDIVVVVQEEPRGTGDAVKAAIGEIAAAETVLVLNGDVPLMSAQALRRLAQAHESAGAAATILTAILEDPNGYGRVVRAPDGSVQKVVESKKPGDATAAELQIREVNTGIFAFAGATLEAALGQIGNDNAQGEYYLPDVLPVLRDHGHTVAATDLADPVEMYGVNDRVQLAAVRAVAQRRIHEHHMLGGATIVSPEATVIDVDVTLGQDVTIEPGSALHGSTTVADGAVVGPHTTLRDASVGAGASVIHSYVVGAEIGSGASVGPFAYLRPGTVLHEGSKAGTFVELKNTEVGARSKVPHLSYVGDATIGEDSNLGASTITANYDGRAKHRTTIGSRVHTSVDTTFVAPVAIGDDAYTGAGSVITKNVPEGALGIARPRQTNIEGYAERVHDRHEQQDERD